MYKLLNYIDNIWKLNIVLVIVIIISLISETSDLIVYRLLGFNIFLSLFNLILVIIYKFKYKNHENNN